MNPYETFVRQITQAYADGKSYSLGQLPAPKKGGSGPDAPVAMIFSPHPDDEVIVGGVVLRLMREAGWRGVNVAVTQGSNKARQLARWEELRACCDYAGFELVQTRPGGLEGINLTTRADHPGRWKEGVERIAAILREYRPRLILFPHEADWNSTHIGTHHLLVDALTVLGEGFGCYVLETEFWGAMASPNLMVEVPEGDLVDLITALTFHVGEVERNPYHLRLPAWMMDNVRRGGELVGGQGRAAPEYVFATLYRLRRWERGGFQTAQDGGRFLGWKEDPGGLFPDPGGQA